MSSLIRTSCMAAAVVALAVWSAPLPAAPQVTHWFVDSLIKVFPTDGPKTSDGAELWGARNQHVSVQLALRSAQPLKEVTAVLSALKSASGQEISSTRVNPVGYVIVTAASDDTPPEELVGQAPGYYPDVLQNFPVDLKGGWTYAVWVSIHVPPGTAPGLYRGNVQVRAGGQEIVSAPVKLTVVAAEVPQERSLKVTNWFTFGDQHSRQFYKAPLLSEDWWTMIGNVAEVMGAHRQSVILTPLSDLVQARAEGDQVRFDFAAFDRWVSVFRERGGFRYIEGEHILSRSDASYHGSLTVAVYLVEDGKVVRKALSPDDPRAEPALTAYLSALNQHLEERGWKKDYLQHILDEPHGKEPPYYARFARVVRKTLPGVPTVDAMDMPDSRQMVHDVVDNSDIWVPILGSFDKASDMLQQRIRDGHEVWFYTCLVPRGRYMNRLIDFPLVKTRLLHWTNFHDNLTGFLHWGGNYWSPDPIRNTQPVINGNDTWLPAGDSAIVYPDKARKSVLSSIRLEAMLEGIEDYELLRQLEKKDPQTARRIVNQAIPSYTDYVRDVPAFRAIQRSLLEAASK